MGFTADPDELLSALNELLEAERAGARVAFRTAKEVLEPELKSPVTAIQRDEAQCDIPSRLAFLNRGRSWVVRRLAARRSTLPTGSPQ
ncbi:MAG TPA: DUF6306 domain-containing protein [Steroidobacteraceae bacterium]|jgi:hypothetical protein|nr:DUF6306 domain-containing protein [Steroidobacteraceae bacterium]